MAVASIIFLLVFFFGFVITVILIYKNRKKFWANGNDSPSFFDGPDASGDISVDHPHSSAGHHSPDIGDVDP